MPDLIPPHGGLSEPIDRTVPAAESEAFRRRAAGLPHVPRSAPPTFPASTASATAACPPSPGP